MDWLGFGATVGSALIPGVGNYLAAKESKEAVREQNLTNIYLAKYQNDRNLDLWNKQNEYNLPSAQMQRLKDAGINPHMVYGNGTVANTAGSPAPTKVPNIGSFTNYAPYVSGMASSVGTVFDNLMKIAQIRKTNQETSNLNEYQNNMRQQGLNLKTENDLKMMSLAKTKAERAYWSQQFELDILQRKADLDLSGEKMRNLTQDTMGRTMQNQVYQKYGEKRAESDLMNSYAAYAMRQTQQQLIQAQIVDTFAAAGLKNAAASKVPYEISLLIANRMQAYNNATLSRKKAIREEINSDIDRILRDNKVNLRSGGPFGTIERGIDALGSLLDSIIPLSF